MTKTEFHKIYCIEALIEAPDKKNYLFNYPVLSTTQKKAISALKKAFLSWPAYLEQGYKLKKARRPRGWPISFGETPRDLVVDETVYSVIKK